MSRAFVREQDLESPEAPPLPTVSGPAYITPGGLAALRRRLQALQRAGDSPQELAQLQARLARAVVVDPAEQPRDRVAFGARVTVRDEGGREAAYRIVGEDEAAPARGEVSARSPLAQALLGARIGEVRHWTRPAGEAELEVVAIEYPPA